MIVHLRCDAARPRGWIAAAAAALAADHHEVSVIWVHGGPPPPVGLDALFKLEQLLLHRTAPCGAATLDDKQRHALATPTDRPDFVIDFTALPPANPSSDPRSLRPLYNGAAGEDAALAAILAGDLPVIDLVNEAGQRVDRGQPSSECASGLSGRLDAVMARTVTLMRANLVGRTRAPSTIQLPSHHGPVASPYSFVAHGLAQALAKRIYRLCCYAPQWHIGWRYIETTGVLETLDLSGQPWRRLAERPYCFNADPFAVTWQGRTCVYFEEFDHRTQKGVIAAVEFNDEGPTGAIFPVLEEPWHLSYPFLIEDGGQLWMIPESSSKREVNLYRCACFPGRWEHHATLLEGIEFGDATITRHNGLYYMFGVTRDGGGYSDTLAIYYARELTGPWLPHDENPIMIDRANARPAGNIVRTGGTLWRPVQDCSRGYGTALGLAEITELSPHIFRQVTRRTIIPSAVWPGRKLHTLNRCGRLEVIDGSRVQPKISLRHGI